MTKTEVIELGNAYKRSCRHSRLVYQLACKVAGRHLDILEDEAEHMDSLTVGVMLLLDMGADVPGELVADTMPHRSMLE